jgi:hypothetical protein
MPLELLNINSVVCATSWWRFAPCVSNRRPGSPQSRQRPRACALLQRDAVLLPVRAAASVVLHFVWNLSGCLRG